MTKETENIEFTRKGDILFAIVPTVQAQDSLHYDVIILIALFAITIWLSQKVMMKTTQTKNMDEQQAKIQKSMGTIMPVMIIATFLFIPIPAGALLYLITSNIFQIAQTVIIAKQLEVEDANKEKEKSLKNGIIDAQVVKKEEKTKK